MIMTNRELKTATENARPYARSIRQIDNGLLSIIWLDGRHVVYHALDDVFNRIAWLCAIGIVNL